MTDFGFDVDGELLARLRAAPEAELPEGFVRQVMAGVARIEARRKVFKRFAVAFAATAAAAALALALIPSAAVETPSPVNGARGTVGAYRQAFAIGSLSGSALESAVEGIVSSQDASGAWAHPRLTKCNVAALADAASRGSQNAKGAYKKGLRWLHANGMVELSREEFAREARMAVAWRGR